MPDGPAPASDGPRPPMNPRAMLSVGLGVVAFALLVVQPFLSLLLSLPALTTSVHARREIAAAGGAQRGFDLAGAGLAVGSATLLLSIVAVFLDLL